MPKNDQSARRLTRVLPGEGHMDMNLMDYVIKEAYILVPVLYVIGVFLKRTPKIPDWLIPLDTDRAWYDRRVFSFRHEAEWDIAGRSGCRGNGVRQSVV